LEAGKSGLLDNEEVYAEYKNRFQEGVLFSSLCYDFNLLVSQHLGDLVTRIPRKFLTSPKKRDKYRKLIDYKMHKRKMSKMNKYLEAGSSSSAAGKSKSSSKKASSKASTKKDSKKITSKRLRRAWKKSLRKEELVDGSTRLIDRAAAQEILLKRSQNDSENNYFVHSKNTVDEAGRQEIIINDEIRAMEEELRGKRKKRKKSNKSKKPESGKKTKKTSQASEILQTSSAKDIEATKASESSAKVKTPTGSVSVTVTAAGDTETDDGTKEKKESLPRAIVPSSPLMPVIDLVNVDVENGEGDVLGDFRFGHFYVRVFVVECKTETVRLIDTLMTVNGYVKAGIMGKDQVYVHSHFITELRMLGHPAPLGSGLIGGRLTEEPGSTYDFDDDDDEEEEVREKNPTIS
jgi:hypothetical protein